MAEDLTGAPVETAPAGTGDGAQTGTGGTPAGNTATPPAESKLYAGKYKSAEELESAYLNLQSNSTKKSQELAGMRKAALGTPKAMEVPAGTPQEDAQVMDYVKNIAQGATAAQLSDVLSKVDRIQTESYLDKMQQDNPEEYEIIAPEIINVLQDNPKLFEQDNYIELASKIARANKMSEIITLATANARNDAYNSRGEKVAGSSRGSKTAQRDTGEIDEAAQILADIVAAGKPSLTQRK